MQWYKKYRPKTLEEMVLDTHLRKKLQEYIKNETAPNILLYGKSGTGKTSIFNILINSIIKSEDDYVELNGSGKSDRSISNLESLEANFLIMPPLKSKKKVVFIDEIEGMKKDSQESLRVTTNEYVNTVSFFGACNDVTKVNQHLRSRFTEFEVTPLDIEEIINILVNILKKENVTFEKKDLIQTIQLYKPDIRRMLNFIQRQTIVSGNKVNFVPNFETDKDVMLIKLVRNMIGFVARKNTKEAQKSILTIIKIMKTHILNYKYILTKLFDLETTPEIKFIWGKYIIKIANTPNEEATCYCAIMEAFIWVKEKFLLKG